MRVARCAWNGINKISGGLSPSLSMTLSSEVLFGDDVGLENHKAGSLQQGEHALADAGTVGPNDRDMTHRGDVLLGSKSLHGPAAPRPPWTTDDSDGATRPHTSGPTCPIALGRSPRPSM
jgi:hypothetical protein